MKPSSYGKLVSALRLLTFTESSCSSHSGFFWWEAHVVLKDLVKWPPLLYGGFDG